MKKTFNITNHSVLVYLGTQHNMSKYIEDLILKDMKSKAESLTKDDVILLIRQYAGTGDKKNNTIKDDSVLNSVKNLISL